MAWSGLRDSIVYMCPIGESSITQKFRFPQVDGGIRMHNGASLSVFLATCVRTDIARQSTSLLGRAGTIYNGFARAK